MGALGEVGTKKVLSPHAGVTLITLVTADTVDAGDTIDVNLADYGCTNVHGVIGFDENTTGSIVIQTQPTTSVTSSVLTITVGAGSDNDVRTFLIWAY